MLPKKEVGKFVYWTPRILSIIFILFLALFSLDVFDSCSGILNCMLGLFMHNLPSLVLLIVLIISWRYEIVGGIVYILAGLLYITLLAVSVIGNGFQGYVISWIFMISGPAFFIGILFLINWFRKKKTKKNKRRK